jgi:hypothetical protein
LTHSIITANPTVHLYFIPLQLEVIVSNFEYSLPTYAYAAFENKGIPPLELTAPNDKDFASQEESYLNFMGQLVSAARSHGLHCIAELGIRSANAFAKRKPAGNSVRFQGSTILLM